MEVKLKHSTLSLSCASALWKRRQICECITSIAFDGSDDSFGFFFARGCGFVFSKFASQNVNLWSKQWLESSSSGNIWLSAETRTTCSWRSKKSSKIYLFRRAKHVAAKVTHGWSTAKRGRWEAKLINNMKASSIPSDFGRKKAPQSKFELSKTETYKVRNSLYEKVVKLRAWIVTAPAWCCWRLRQNSSRNKTQCHGVTMHFASL